MWYIITCVLIIMFFLFFFFFSSRRRHTRFDCDWSSDVCSSDLSRWNAHSVQRAEGPRLDFVVLRRHLPGEHRGQVLKENCGHSWAGLEIGRASCRERV